MARENNGPEDDRLTDSERLALPQIQIVSRLTTCGTAHEIGIIAPQSRHSPLNFHLNFFTKQTHIHHVLLDASGSMQDCYDVTIAALNGQIKSLREVQEKYPDQDVRFAISDFSNDYRLWLPLVDP